MKLLLDTHILLWTLLDSPELPERARELIANPENDIFYSIVVPWEVEIKNIKHNIEEIKSLKDKLTALDLKVDEVLINFEKIRNITLNL